MAITFEKIEKGTTLNLTKKDDSLKIVKAILYWKAPNHFPAFDLDASAFVLKATANGNKLISDEWFIFFNQESSPNNAVTKTPDERSGGTEEILIDISKLPVDVSEISIVVTIYKGDERKQTFGQIEEAGIKIVNADSGDELAFFDLDADFKDETAVQVGSFYKENDNFSFQAVGAGYKLDLTAFYNGYKN